MHSETEEFILEDLFSSVLSQFRKYHTSGNLKFSNLGNSQGLKFRILMEKVLPISFKPISAQRCRSETEKHILEDHFSLVLSQFKKYHPSGKLKTKNLGIFQSLKLRNLM